MITSKSLWKMSASLMTHFDIVHADHHSSWDPKRPRYTRRETAMRITFV